MSSKKLKKKYLGNIEYREGSENIFADIGIRNPAEALAKAKAGVKKKRLTQTKAAKILKTHRKCV